MAHSRQGAERVHCPGPAVLSCYDRGPGAVGNEMNDGIINQASREAKTKDLPRIWPHLECA